MPWLSSAMSIREEISRPVPEKHFFSLRTDDGPLNVELTRPAGNAGLVIFSEESRTSRDAYRQAIANVLNKHDLATLLPVASVSERSRQAGNRMEQMLLWARQHPQTSDLPLGFFAVDDGGADALTAAAHRPDVARALVLRSGAYDRALDDLPFVKAPVLLIAAGRDPIGLRHSRQILAKLNGSSTMNIIPSATGAFQEPGVTEESAQLAALWFLQHLNLSA